MEATKQVKFEEIIEKPVDMFKVKLDELKRIINKKITEIFQIEKFVLNELILEQFVNPMKLHIHMTEFLDGPRIKQFICELWPILLEAEESAAPIPNLPIELKNQHKNGYERSKSSSHSRSRKQSNVVNSGKERPTDSQNSSTGGSTKAETKQCISVVNGGKQVPPKTFSSIIKPQGRIDISKVKLDLLKPWITEKITDILQREDNAVVEFVYNKLKQDRMLCPQKLRIRISGFLHGGNAQKFVNELWPLLLSSQEDGSASISRSTNRQNNTKPDQNQRSAACTFSSKKQQPDKENNKNSINMENESFKQAKSLPKDNVIDKERKHSSRSTSHTKSSSKIVSQSNDCGIYDGKTCGSNGFVNICMLSPTKLQPETKAISKDNRCSAIFPEYLSEYCAQTEDFLKLWNEEPDKQTILLADKFVYPDAKNIGKQINNTLFPPPSSVSKSGHKHQRSNIHFDMVVKAEEEIKAARALHSCKRSHSTMINESKKSKNISSCKDEQQPAKKNPTKTKKSSSKHSSGKGSFRKPNAESSKKETQKKYNNETRERMLELFGSCSSDEEECRPDKTSSKELVAESKQTKDYKKSNNEMNKLVFDIFGSMSSDEENV